MTHSGSTTDSDARSKSVFLAVVDDLMSLLDAGMHADHPGVIIDSDAMFGENMFGYSALRGRAAMRSRVGSFILSVWYV